MGQPAVVEDLDRVIGIVIVAHGGLAREYLAAIEHVVGHQDGVRAIIIEDDCDRSGKQDEICAAADAVDRGAGGDIRDRHDRRLAL